jgi:hypothetical protein
MISTIVGFNVLSDSKDPDIVLTQTPGGTLLRTNLRTRDQQSVGPQVRNYGGATAAEMKYRFAWDAPLTRSPFGADTFYYGGNVVFQSSDEGQSWEPISGDLSRADPAKMRPSGGPVFTDNSNSETYGTVTTIAESPAKRGVIWAGTDDGNLQVTVNGGGRWTNVAANLPGVAVGSPVSAIEPSHKDENVAYAALDRHMFDDMQPYLYRTSDGGKTWKKITNGLPSNAFVWVVREDLKNPNLLYLGTELGLFASFDAGDHWVPFGLKNLPDVAVRDIFIQPAHNDILLATHGRGLWILDDATPVQQIAAAANRAQYLFPIRPALRYTVRATRAGGGDTEYAAPNPPYGAILSYYLRQAADGVRFDVLDGTGATVASITGARVAKDAGLHQVAWDLRAAGAGARGPQVLPGTYTVKMTVGSVVEDQKVEVQLDPDLTTSAADLTAQWDTANKISTMMRSVADMLREADKHTDSASTDSKPWQKFRETLARPKELSNSETGPRLSEQLQALFNLIDGANDAPTHAMMSLLGELQDAYLKATDDFKRLTK